jgi:cystathionine beta-lyase/cystathionine gamma-synthase
MSKQPKRPSVFTTCAQAGLRLPASQARPAMPPIVPSVGFIYENMQQTDAALGDDSTDFVYSRHGAPTQAAFEEAVARLEGADEAVSFSSGMAALHAAILVVAHKGGHIVAGDLLYGATRTLLGWLSANMDMEIHYVDLRDLDATQALIKRIEPTALICEVLTNPTVRMIDLPPVVEMAHSVAAQVVVDNTFATPFLLCPLEHGADLVVHSATKFLNGHGDVLGGVLAGPPDMCRVARNHRKLLGAMFGPFDAWLALRGLRTLPVRMRQASLTARRVAAWLAAHPRIKRVYYPGLTEDEGYQVAKRLFREGFFGAVLAFEVDGATRADAFKLVESLRLIRPVTSLGDPATLISHPATSSHRALDVGEREGLGITEGLLRLSVGLEDPQDLVGDLNGALSAL